MEELKENLEGVSTSIEQAIFNLKDTKYADDQEIKKMMATINNTIGYIIDYIEE
jgi:hypothetical protein